MPYLSAHRDVDVSLSDSDHMAEYGSIGKPHRPRSLARRIAAAIDPSRMTLAGTLLGFSLATGLVLLASAYLTRELLTLLLQHDHVDVLRSMSGI